jgi:stage II sporulation protein D
LVVEPVVGDTIVMNGAVYPGRVVLRACWGGGGDDRFDAVNYTAVDRYLSGVLGCELFPGWHANTYAVQAIAARSYALAEIDRHRDRHYDVEATEASQVYSGAKVSAKALDAVRRTRGVALTFQGRVFHAYYSSACGGLGQDAVAAIVRADAVAPLSARDHGNDCAASPNRRWGPIVRDRVDLTRRIAAWGRAHGDAIAGLSSIAGITVVKRNAVGRPTRFAVMDGLGRGYDLAPESFRFACNYADADLPLLPKELQVKSSYLSVVVQEQSVRFDGYGYGHGVGLCQWGAEGLAGRGYDPYAILGFYYPGAKLRRWF